MIKKYQKQAETNTSLNNNHREYMKTLNIKQLMTNIEYIRIYDCSTLLECIHWLNEYIQHNPSIKLICIDSIAFHFRYGWNNNYQMRNRLLSQLTLQLNKLVRDRHIILVVTNHTTTHYSNNNNNTQTSLKPALGEVWLAGGSANRIIMQYNTLKQRTAMLHKSMQSSTPYQAIYDITNDGIVDVQQNI